MGQKGKLVSGLVKAGGTLRRERRACKGAGPLRRWPGLLPERLEERVGRDAERQLRFPERTRCKEGASDPPLEDRIKDKDVTRFFGGLKMLLSNISNGQQTRFLSRRMENCLLDQQKAHVWRRKMSPKVTSPTHFNHILPNLQTKWHGSCSLLWGWLPVSWLPRQTESCGYVQVNSFCYNESEISGFPPPPSPSRCHFKTNEDGGEFAEVTSWYGLVRRWHVQVGEGWRWRWGGCRLFYGQVILDAIPVRPAWRLLQTGEK